MWPWQLRIKLRKYISMKHEAGLLICLAMLFLNYLLQLTILNSYPSVTPHMGYALV